MSANTETTGAPPKGYVGCPKKCGRYAGVGSWCWECRAKERPIGRDEREVTMLQFPDWTPPIAPPAAHVERRKGQTWEYQFQDDEPLYHVVLTERCEPNAWATEKHGMIFDAAWSGPNVRMTLLADAPPEPQRSPIRPGSGLCCAKGYVGAGHNDWCQKSPPAQEAPKAAPVCMWHERHKCNLPIRERFVKVGAISLCDWAMHQNEKLIASRTDGTGKPYVGPERLPKPQLAADWVEDCLPESGR